MSGNIVAHLSRGNVGPAHGMLPLTVALRTVDIIRKKRDGGELSREEISYLVQGYTQGEIPDYQIAAFLMAVFFRGLTPEETGVLTREMIESGGTIDLSGIDGPFVDKHSTGGVGDKVSLILAPIAAACDIRVPMMSGRSLGHTGGTLDKLESIPGYRIARDEEEFRRILRAVGYAMTGQSDRIAPADRLLYALRDVTSTVESVPLITGSILSKKFAEGAEALVFDVKCGSGAFMKTRDEAETLARSLVRTGKALGRQVVACITRMDEPLGWTVGNFLEVEESVYCLRPDLAPSGYRVPEDLMEVTLRLAGWMVYLGGKVSSVEEGVDRSRNALDSGKAFEIFQRNVAEQGGDPDRLLGLLGHRRAAVHRRVTAPSGGTVARVDAYSFGLAGIAVGAGRSAREDVIRQDAGFILGCKIGDEVQPGDTLVDVYADDEEACAEAVDILKGAFRIDPGHPPDRRGTAVLDEICER